MITINYLFWLLGIVLLIVGSMIMSDREHPRRFLAGGFWIIYALIFLVGDRLPLDVQLGEARVALGGVDRARFGDQPFAAHAACSESRPNAVWSTRTASSV